MLLQLLHCGEARAAGPTDVAALFVHAEQMLVEVAPAREERAAHRARVFLGALVHLADVLIHWSYNSLALIYPPTSRAVSIYCSHDIYRCLCSRLL